jgi:hypothetical protein
MTSTVAGSVHGLVNLVQSNPIDLVTGVGDLLKKAAIAYTDGSGANQINALFSDQRTLTTGANEDLDLAAALVDLYGVTLTFTSIKGILIASAVANTTDLTLTEPAANGLTGLFVAASDGINIEPGGFFMWGTPSAAGLAVTAGTGDLINIANAAGASAIYDVVIWGTK